MGEAMLKFDSAPRAANFASTVGACTGIVESLKHLLSATAHPQFLVLELQTLDQGITVTTLPYKRSKYVYICDDLA